MRISGTGFRADGRVHSDRSLVVSGSRSRMTGGVEYGTTVSVSGTGHVLSPAARKVAPGGSPHRVPLSDYRPGGAAAGVFDAGDEGRSDGAEADEQDAELAGGRFNLAGGGSDEIFSFQNNTS